MLERRRDRQTADGHDITSTYADGADMGRFRREASMHFFAHRSLAIIALCAYRLRRASLGDDISSRAQARQPFTMPGALRDWAGCLLRRVASLSFASNYFL